jgi:hypothetical protein
MAKKKDTPDDPSLVLLSKDGATVKAHPDQVALWIKNGWSLAEGEADPGKTKADLLARIAAAHTPEELDELVAADETDPDILAAAQARSDELEVDHH